MFWEVLKAPANATFLEIVARHDYRQRRGLELSKASQIDKRARKLQTQALSLRYFDSEALEAFEHLLALSNEAATLAQQHMPAKPGESDPLMSRFRVLLNALMAQDGLLRAAIGTLSASELLAVETRVLKTTQKRLKDEFEQIMQHATTQIDTARAHLGRLFHQLAAAEQKTYREKMSANAQTALEAS